MNIESGAVYKEELLIDEIEVRKTVLSILREYRAFKVSVENKQEQDEMNLSLFPVLKDNFQKKLLIVKQIDRALSALDDIEKEIIQKKYLTNIRAKDIDVYLDMNIQKRQYYTHKKEAITLIAKALGII